MTKIYFISIALLLILIGCKSEHSVNPITTKNGKPDLIIDNVTYTRLPNCYQGYPSGIICGGPRFEFVLKIKNIGLANISSPLYICNSRSSWDFENKYCSSGHRLNDPPLPILIDSSITIKFISDIDDSVKNVLFVLNTNDFFNSGSSIPRVEESDYTNNSYIKMLIW
jgi:hypothetical protein